MAVVSDYNPGDLLTGTAGEGGDDESAVKDLAINEDRVKTLASFADLQATDLSPALINPTRELVIKQDYQPQSVMSTGDGILMVWFKENGGSMNIEFLSDGACELYVEDEPNG
ncbi:MAG: hypothetical protein IJ547_06740, partial [Clostridia bacterium]|nr:hypothetical protein [Clostridia bacterium]